MWLSFVGGELSWYWGQSDSFCACVAHLFNSIARCGMPKQWNRLVISSLFKKGDKQDANNYIGLAVSSILPKLFVIVLGEQFTVRVDDLELHVPVRR